MFFQGGELPPYYKPCSVGVVLKEWIYLSSAYRLTCKVCSTGIYFRKNWLVFIFSKNLFQKPDFYQVSWITLTSRRHQISVFYMRLISPKSIYSARTSFVLNKTYRGRICHSQNGLSQSFWNFKMHGKCVVTAMPCCMSVICNQNHFGIQYATAWTIHVQGISRGCFV